MSGTDHFSSASYIPENAIGCRRDDLIVVKTYGKYRVVCEKERVGNNRPCAIPREFLLIDKDAHELDNSKCWMRLTSPSAARFVAS
jgi:hypothetical protein